MAFITFTKDFKNGVNASVTTTLKMVWKFAICRSIPPENAPNKAAVCPLNKLSGKNKITAPTTLKARLNIAVFCASIDFDNDAITTEKHVPILEPKIKNIAFSKPINPLEAKTIIIEVTAEEL